MSNPPPQLTLTGNAHPAKVAYAATGDVAIHPGASRTHFIDATIFDGSVWRALDLSGFGFRKGERGFDHSAGIGPLMRQIAQVIERRKGAMVHYEIPAGRKTRKYVYRGASLPPWLQGFRSFY